MAREKILNVPNLLSFYRLLTFPFVLYLVYTGNEKLFSVLLCINLVTDILDGLIARAFKLQTNFGARLDSLADIGTYILAVTGIFKFKWHDIQQYGAFMWVFLITYLLAYVVSFVKFSKFPSLHLYSVKAGGYVQGFFFFMLFFSGFNAVFFIVAMLWGICSYLEETAVLIALPQLQSNCKGLFWVLKGRNNELKTR